MQCCYYPVSYTHLNHAAHAYFDDLPDYVREMIVKRGDNVHSPDELHGYAEKLLRGDD